MRARIFRYLIYSENVYGFDLFLFFFFFTGYIWPRLAAIMRRSYTLILMASLSLITSTLFLRGSKVWDWHRTCTWNTKRNAARAHERNKKIMPRRIAPQKVREMGQIDRSRANANEQSSWISRASRRVTPWPFPPSKHHANALPANVVYVFINIILFLFFFFFPRRNYFLGPIDLIMFVWNIIESKWSKTPGTVDVGACDKRPNETSAKTVNVKSAAEYHGRWNGSENKTGRTMQPIFVPFKCVISKRPSTILTT